MPTHETTSARSSAAGTDHEATPRRGSKKDRASTASAEERTSSNAGPARSTWAGVGSASRPIAAAAARRSQLGYRIDSLAAIMFLMVTFIATLIHLFSIGYMAR